MPLMHYDPLVAPYAYGQPPCLMISLDLATDWCTAVCKYKRNRNTDINTITGEIHIHYTYTIYI